jgi:hypothetical protein
VPKSHVYRVLRSGSAGQQRARQARLPPAHGDRVSCRRCDCRRWRAARRRSPSTCA